MPQHNSFKMSTPGEKYLSIASGSHSNRLSITSEYSVLLVRPPRRPRGRSQMWTNGIPLGPRR